MKEEKSFDDIWDQSHLFAGMTMLFVIVEVVTWRYFDREWFETYKNTEFWFVVIMTLILIPGAMSAAQIVESIWRPENRHALLYRVGVKLELTGWALLFFYWFYRREAGVLTFSIVICVIALMLIWNFRRSQDPLGIRDENRKKVRKARKGKVPRV